MGSKLAELCAGTERLSLETAGQVAYDGFRAPLWVVRFQPLEIRKRILITGGVHGNEPAGAAWMVELITLLAENPELYPYCAFDLVPVVNPWGWSRDIRFNKDGRDINRDFASFETQEAQIMRQVFESAEYDLVIDHHEDPDACGFYLYQYAKRDQSVSREVISKIRDLGYPIEQDVHMVILHTKDGLIDAPRWGPDVYASDPTTEHYKLSQAQAQRPGLYDRDSDRCRYARPAADAQTSFRDDY